MVKNAVDFSTEPLIRALGRLSDEIKREAAGIVDATAHAVVARLKSRYPVGPTGNLRNRIFVTAPKSFSTTADGQAVMTKRVRASAPHLYIWQSGTKERFDSTRKGASRGIMPAGGKILEATAADARREMNGKFHDILTRELNL